MQKRSLKRFISLAVSVLMVLCLTVSTDVFAVEDNTGRFHCGLERPRIATGKITQAEYEEIENRYSAGTRKRSLRSTNDDYWKQFSQPYYNYTNGLSEEQIDLYNRMYDVLYEMIEGGVDLSETIWDDRYLTPIVKSNRPMSEDDVGFVGLLIAYNHPELYFLNSGLQILEVEGTGERTLQLCVYLDLGTCAARETKAAELKTKIEEYRRQITGSTPLEREISIQNLICDNTVYSRAEHDQSCVSVFLENKSVCAVYSEAFNLLCNAVGIPAIAVTSEMHEWSQVKLDGRWYAVDVTWDDDEDEPENRFDYFNISDYTLKSGSEYDNVMHTVEEIPWDYVGRPACCYDYPDIENHDWCISGFTWSEDNKTCVAILECMGDETHTKTLNATVTSKVVVEPTTITKGTTEYTATFEDERIDTQTKRVQDIPCIKPEPSSQQPEPSSQQREPSSQQPSYEDSYSSDDDDDPVPSGNEEPGTNASVSATRTGRVWMDQEKRERIDTLPSEQKDNAPLDQAGTGNEVIIQGVRAVTLEENRASSTVDEIRAALRDALSEGSSGETAVIPTVKVNMVNADGLVATALPRSILEAAKGQDVNITLDMGGYSWTIYGKDISEIKDVNLEVRDDSNAVPESVVAALAGSNPTKQMSLTFDGDFGFKAYLTVNLGSQNAGKYGNLYLYDKAGSLVFMSKGRIGEDGGTTLEFTHASDYVIVINDTGTLSENSVSDLWIIILAAAITAAVLEIGFVVYGKKIPFISR